MWSRREQHHAYQFLTRRITSAMLSGEPDSNELPMRRFGVALFSGVAVALLVIAGFTVYGLLFPGGGRPAENVIILERETGAIFIYVDGRLHPVLNLTSARLILGQVEVKSMARVSLRDVPRGPAVGIQGAPDSLPDQASLVGLPWTVCSAPSAPQSVRLATHVLVGSIPDGGAPLSDPNGLLVASSATGERFLLWGGHRLRVPGNTVLAALGWAAVLPLPVAHPFLNAIPPGPDLVAPAIADDGQPAPHLVDGAPTALGQLFHATGQHYVMTAEGLAPVGALTARLWQAAGRTMTQTSASEAGRLLTQTRVEPAGLPDVVPMAAGQDGSAMACAAYTGSDGIRVDVYGRVPESFPSTSGDNDDGLTADRVAVPGGRGALVATLLPDDTTATGVVYLVTDQGIRYPLATQDTDAVRAALGYGAVTPVTVPATLLDLLPAGPALDPQLASAFAQ